MLFNSLSFLIFFPVVTLLYWILPHRFRWMHLLIASCIFYAAFIPVYIFILFFTIVVDYFAGIVIANATGKKRKLYLTISIVTNVGILSVFKYYNFFIININDFFHSIHLVTHPIPYLSLILPIGLSFHTFQAMSYTIEVYRGNQKPETHFGIYALYVMFYPQLVAGPIERPQNLLHQFHEPHYFKKEQFFNGLRLMLFGFFKKIVVADRLAIYVSGVYNHPGDFHYLNLIIATLFFTIQIYCDFSGYSDIALGAARTMGFDLMVNFNRPYFALNIQEFWKKWHISLSTWFRDYLYISMGGNRVGIKRLYFNVAVVFLVSGFWHGANWTFVIWGAIHTIYILFYMIRVDLFKLKFKSTWFLNSVSWLITFVLVAFAWIFFRANSFADALTVVHNILLLNHVHPFVLAVSNSVTEFGKTSFVIALVAIFVLFFSEKILPANLEKLNKYPVFDVLFCSAILSIIGCFGIFYNTSFIYFQF